VTEVTWSRCGGRDCIRLTDMPAGPNVQVRPGTASAVAAGLPPMAGRLVHDGADAYFFPRFTFIDGTAYTVTVEGAIAATLVRARPDRMATTEVDGIHPTSTEVPRNLLRLYVWFTAPMSDGYAAGHVRLANDNGGTIGGALLPGEHELWDASRRRLTVLLDPAGSSAAWPATRIMATRCDLASHSGSWSTTGSVMRRDSPCERGRTGGMRSATTSDAMSTPAAGC
jgi:hypothetical protein